MSFTVGQEVECISSFCWGLTCGKSYVIEELDLSDYQYCGGILITNNYNEQRWYSTTYFKKDEPKQQEKEMTEEYEVIKPFTGADIWKAFKEHHFCADFLREWGDFIDEYDDEYNTVGWDFDEIDEILDSGVLKKNLHHLEKKGLIRKVKKETTLVPGMRLKTIYDGLTYRIINCSDKISVMNKFSILVEGRDFGYNSGETFTCKTLEELNNITGEGFEVIDD